MVEATEVNFTDDRDYAKFVIEDAEKPLYKGCPAFTELSTLVKLFNVKSKYRVSDKCCTEFIIVFKKMLQEGNEMASSTYEVKRTFKAMRSGIAADGVDVNRGNRHHSVWPVLAVIYNLPPWFCMKRKFIMLSLLISGTPGNDIDVFLAPLIEDLQQLFDTGVETYDAYARERFTLHVVVSWTINDYPAHGTLCGCPYSGFFGCVVCGKETNFVRLRRSNKQSYGGHRRYLPYDHPFRKQKKGFDGTQEFRNEPIPKNGVEIYNEMQYCIKIWGKGHKINASGLQQASNGRGGNKRIKYNRRRQQRKEIEVEEVDKLEVDLFVTLCLLEKYLPRSFFDVMIHLTVHIAREVKLCGPVCFRWMYPSERCMKVIKGHVRNKNKPERCIVEQNVDEETIEFLSEFKKELNTIGIPNSLRNSIENKNRASNKNQRKEIEVEEVDKLEVDLFVTLCLLEKYLPRSFFDVMIHLTVHIAREVKLCGPVCFRWMYPSERCMKVIKGHIRNKNKPERCIVEQNVAEETIEFLSEFKKELNTIGIPNSLRNSIENKNRANFMHIEKNVAESLIGTLLNIPGKTKDGLEA
ncbi:uncharacterized protein LOC143623057 [Bidens hawaiensis]|uniref:uncharacterized protein LOC143623057 n=1 Tax=Bidens hawaiensis TaxID=980011 RepID=UPI00404B6E59